MTKCEEKMTRVFNSLNYTTEVEIMLKRPVRKEELFEGQGYEIIVVDIPLRHYENLNMLVCDNIYLRRADGMPI